MQINLEKLMVEIEGIYIEIYSRDHNPPHFHAFYAEYEILIEIKTLKILAGYMPNKILKKVFNIAKIYQNEMLLEFEKLNPQNRK